MMSEEFLLTTADNLEGHVIVKQCGLVFGEYNTAYDGGLIKQIEYVEILRKNAIGKLTEAARKAGGNAVVAIRSNEYLAGGILYYSVYGTAVKVISVEDKREFERAELERKTAEELEKTAAEERKRALQERKEKGDISAEEDIIYKISCLYSMIAIWKLWNDSSIKEDYPEVGKFIEEKKEYERLYGRAYMNMDDLKKTIIDMLMSDE